MFCCSCEHLANRFEVSKIATLVWLAVSPVRRWLFSLSELRWLVVGDIGGWWVQSFTVLIPGRQKNIPGRGKKTDLDETVDGSEIR